VVNTVTAILPERRIAPDVLHDLDVGAARLGRHIEHDIRSAAFAVEHELDEFQSIFARSDARPSIPRKLEWPRLVPIFDQGDLGSCTGNATTGWAGSARRGYSDLSWLPKGLVPDEDLAVRVYELATTLDDVPGQYPPDDTGSSGLAVAKAAQRLDFVKSYKHAFTQTGMLVALQAGPIIVGVNWYEGFDHPASDGSVLPTGQVRGGHEFLIRGYDLDAGWYVADNSWGEGYALGGSFRVPFSTWTKLASEGGDVVSLRY
jgi:hypothetical protein